MLAGLNERIASGGPPPLDDVGTVHFARWVVLPDGADGGRLLFVIIEMVRGGRKIAPEKEGGVHFAGLVLLFASNFDGPWDDYIRDFAAQSAASFDAIYSNCEGWPERGARDLEAFKAYIRKHELRPDVYYRAYPQATVQQVKFALRLRTAMDSLLAALNE